MQLNDIEYFLDDEMPRSTVLGNNVFMKQRVKKVLTYLSDVLTWHYGPYSRFALVANLDNPLEEPKFTKDGINIIRSISFQNPVDNYINQVIAFIGSRIENAIGDGTTSAMLFVCQFLFELIEHDAVANIDYRNLRTIFDVLVNLYEEEQKKETIYLSDIKDPVLHRNAIANIAYAQAYTSSHGDTKLAELIQQVFLSAPENTWNVMTFARDNFETDTPVSVDIDDSQYSLQCGIHHPYMLNKDGGTRFEVKDAVLVIAPWGFDGAAKEQTENLLKMVTKIAEKDVDEDLKDKHWVMVIPRIRDAHYYSAIEDAVMNYADIWERFGIFEYGSENDTINDYHGLCAVMGIDYRRVIERGQPVIKTDVDAYYGTDRKLKLYNIYDFGESDDSELHPLLTKEGPFKAYVDLVSSTINNMRNSIQTLNPRDVEQLKKFQELHRKLVVRKRVTIRIGGGAIDNTANVDVVTDVILATRNSLMNGCVRGGNMAMLATFKRLFATIDGDLIPLDAYTKTYLSNLSGAAVQALTRMIRVAYESVHGDNVAAANKILEACSGEEFMSYNQLDDMFVNMKSLAESDPKVPANVIIQPAGTSVAILKRFAEVGLKLLKTEEIVTPGFVHTIHKPVTNRSSVTATAMPLSNEPIGLA